MSPTIRHYLRFAVFWAIWSVLLASLYLLVMVYANPQGLYVP
jgi:hypothetical protein